MLEEERSETQYFQPLPFYYVEISKLLFQHAVETFGENYMEVRCKHDTASESVRTLAAEQQTAAESAQCSGAAL